MPESRLTHEEHEHCLRSLHSRHQTESSDGGSRTTLTREPVLYTHIHGKELLNNPRLNKGTAFTPAERRQFDLETLLPTATNTLDEQVDRAYGQYAMLPSPLLKNAFCESMRVQNQVLYYALITRHLEEMMEIIYTPTQGDAIIQYSKLFRRPNGCFMNINRPDLIENALSHWGRHQGVDYVVVSDAEGILGIGDQGVGGVAITTAKLALMTACGGIHPDRVIPIVIDCGTNNKELLNDPLYLGNRHERVRGEEYDNFIDRMVNAINGKYPDAVIHFEDFGTSNAYRILDRYKEKIPCFNDDIEGTGAVTVASIKSALHVTQSSPKDCRILMFGAGSAGVGIANQIVDNLVNYEGLSEAEAKQYIFLMDRHGLVTSNLSDDLITDIQRPFVHDGEKFKDIDTTDLQAVVAAIKPQVLIGASTQAGAFTEKVVKEMAQHVERPIILPLSNPTKLHEATPGDLIDWTDGKVLVATGSPFGVVRGRKIAENNNMFIFPGIGLGAVLSRAKLITKKQIAVAIEELVSLSPVLLNPQNPLLPSIKDIHFISARIATAVVLQAKKEGLARIEEHSSPASEDLITIPENYEECFDWVQSQMWKPEYRRFVRSVS